MYRLPDQIKNVLVSEFSLGNYFKKPDDKSVLDRFLMSRRVSKNDQSVLMPIIELINHSPFGLSYDTQDGISIEGRCSSETGEIFASYSMLDSWGKFNNYGFATPERFAFSEPFVADAKNQSLSIKVRRHLNERKKGEDHLPHPVVIKNFCEIDISFLIVGDRKSAENPVKLYKNDVHPYLNSNADEFFETLVYINRLKFLKLLAATEGHSSEIIDMIRQVCRYQLEALSCCWFGNWAFQIK